MSISLIFLDTILSFKYELPNECIISNINKILLVISVKQHSTLGALGKGFF